MNESNSMPPKEEHEQPKHRSLRLTPERHSPFTRRLARVLFTTVALALFSLIAYLITHPKEPNVPGPYQQAEELNRLIHQDARFAEVRASCWYPNVEIQNFEQLADDARTDLERLASRYAKQNNVSVLYSSRETELDNTSEKK